MRYSLSKRLEEFTNLLKQGWEIYSIQLTFTRKPVLERWEVELKKGDNTKLIVAENDENFSHHIIHYHKLIDIKTDKIRFQYIENTAKYFELEEKIVSFLCGKKPYLNVLTRKPELNLIDIKRINASIETWIQSEKFLMAYPTSISRLFYDILVIRKIRGKIDFLILEKEKISRQDIIKLIEESKNTDWTKCFTSVFLSSKIKKSTNINTILVSLLYDAKKRKVEAACVGTLESLLKYCKKPLLKKGELALLIEEMIGETIQLDQFRICLMAPWINPDFTPVPWITYLLIGNLSHKIDKVKVGSCLYPHESLVFGNTGLPSKRNSFVFKPKSQTAAIIVQLNGKDCYVTRYDRSPGEAKFHIDCEISNKRSKIKLLKHHKVMFNDIWDLSENLYISFLAAGAFDVKFTELVKRDVRDFNELMSKEPLATYPLLINSMVDDKEKFVSKTPDALNLMKKILKIPNYVPSKNEIMIINELEQNGLIAKGGLTHLAVMVISRSISVQ